MQTREVYDLHPLFEDVQINRIFPDGKTFVDCFPRLPINEIGDLYETIRKKPGFDLKEFILSNFIPPQPHSEIYKWDPSRSVEEHIDALWSVLTRRPDTTGGSLIPLPFPYIVPGGRFGEIYYWDSYFTMLGLHEAGNFDMIENMVNNFSFLIDSFGYIPNGNRSYFLGRSQPPFYSMMVQLLAESKGKDILVKYLPQLLKEYSFWMKGSDELEPGQAAFHSVRLGKGELMNRYWDENDTPRPESYAADMELAEKANRDPRTLFRHLRAGAESGWDYSYRWFKDETSFATIHTTDIIPVDLNCLLLQLERTLGEAYIIEGDESKARQYADLAAKRWSSISKFCWNNNLNFFTDFDWCNNIQKQVLSLAGTYPLYFRLATDEQAENIAGVLREKFLKPGGVIATLKITGQQWDAPNGWAPLHWMTIIGLENYGHHDLAADIARRWIRLNTEVYKRTGKLMEKYNVIDTHLEAGGGEYAGQDGFGWTNGVLLALIKKYGSFE